MAYANLLKSRRQVWRQALRDKFAGTAAAEPELLAHHFTQAGMTEATIEWWDKAGQRSLKRSARVPMGLTFTGTPVRPTQSPLSGQTSVRAR